MKGVRRQRTLHQKHNSINQYITLAKWKEIIIKGVRRGGNSGFRLALIMSRMIVMIILSADYQHQNGRAFRPKNGGEHPKSSYDSFQKSGRSGERPAPGALINLIDSDSVNCFALCFVMNAHGYLVLGDGHAMILRAHF